MAALSASGRGPARGSLDRDSSLPSRPLFAAARGARPRMSGAELFGLVVSVLVVAYLALRAAARREAVTAQGWLQIAIYVAVLTALTPVIGAYMARVYRGERVFLTPVLGPVERLIYRLIRVDPAVDQDWKAYARTALVFSALFWVVALPDPAHPGHPPLQPRGLRLGHLGRDVQHRVVVRLEHELAVLRRRDDAVVLLADGRARRPELRLGGRRHRRRDRRHPRLRRAAAATSLGNFWQDLTRTLLYVLLPISFVGALFLVSQGVIQNLSAYGRTTRSRAASRRWRSARSPRRRRSSSSAPTAAASSTSTARCRSRTRAASRTSSRCCSSC